MITFIVSTLLYNIFKNNHVAEEVSAKYSRILVEDSIDGIVKSTFFPEGWRGGSIGQYVTLKSGKNIFIDAKEFVTLGLKDIRWIINSESRIIKKSYSDTMDVYCKGDKYSIIIYVE